MARNKRLATSRDKTSFTVAWECTPGRFNWHYTEDEFVRIISGEVFITMANGTERRLGPGDMAFFPAGSSCTWGYRMRPKSCSSLRKDMPQLLSQGIRSSYSCSGWWESG